MFPEDRVLVAVVNRRRDFLAARDEGWYRLPVMRFTRAVDFEVLALFQSAAFGSDNGAVRWYADVRGVELVRRRDVLPAEAAHPRADDYYLRLALGRLQRKDPPVRNSTGRRISFIHTTWDRFERAVSIADLYSSAPYYVDRVYYALR